MSYRTMGKDCLVSSISNNGNIFVNVFSGTVLETASKLFGMYNHDPLYCVRDNDRVDFFFADPLCSIFFLSAIKTNFGTALK